MLELPFRLDGTAQHASGARTRFALAVATPNRTPFRYGAFRAPATCTHCHLPRGGIVGESPSQVLQLTLRHVGIMTYWNHLEIFGRHGAAVDFAALARVAGKPDSICYRDFLFEFEPLPGSPMPSRIGVRAFDEADALVKLERLHRRETWPPLRAVREFDPERETLAPDCLPRRIRELHTGVFFPRMRGSYHRDRYPGAPD
jgi:hypothetical protein